MDRIRGAARAGVADEGRRRLLKAGGGLALSFTWLGAASPALGFVSSRPQPGDPAAARADGSPAFAPNALIRIGSDGVVRLVMPQVEMGQGSYTGQATLLAEELCVDLDQVRLEHSPPSDELYGFKEQGGQITGGSQTIHLSWMPLREAGAVARTMLIGAAAARWNVPVAQCRAERGTVHHAASGRSLGYGALAEAAAHQPVPDKPELLSASAYRLIGKPLKRLDTPSKVDGSLAFGIDVRVPGMRYAAVATRPVVGGRLRQVDERRARALPGVLDVVKIDDAVAVIAGDTWTARRGLAALSIEWDPGPNAALSTEGIRAEMAQLSRTARGALAKEVGAGAVPTARRVEAVYEAPFLAHTTMEPMNAVVSVSAERCEIWTGTQVPVRAVEAAARITGLPAGKIVLHNHYMGGGFGRRLETDYVEQAVALARQVPYPLKVLWTRELDIRHDVFRPPYHDHLVATLDDHGRPATWTHRVTADSVLERFSPGDMPADGVDPDCVDGAIDPPYALPHRRIEFVRHRLPTAVKIGWYRGVGQTHTLFPVESFVDECAHAAGQDPVAYRRALLAENPRARAVLDLAAERFGWDRRPGGPRIGRGVALGRPFDTLICAIVEVEVTPTGVVRLRRAAAAVDCGIVINPDTVTAQIQGGLVFGLTTALFGEVTMRDGAVEQQNFNDYRLLRMNEAPPVEAYLVDSHEPPTGIGEPPCCISAPALANAIFAATGVRVRRLPVARATLAERGASLDQVVT